MQTTPRVKFDDRSLYLLSTDPRKLKIGRNGITLTIPGIGKVNYKSEETGRRQGEEVIAWVQPRRPDVLTCTTLDKKKVFTIERYNPVDAFNCDREEFAIEDAKVSAHNGYAVERYRTLVATLSSSHSGRTGAALFAVDRRTTELGREMEQQQAVVTAKRDDRKRLHETIERKSARAGISSRLVRKSADVPQALDKLRAAREAVSKKLREAESSGGGDSVAVKTYVLTDDASSQPLSPQQRTGIYWRLYDAANAAQPGLNRFAVTTKALGYVKKITEMTDTEFRKVCHIFESIAKKANNGESQ